MNFDINKHVIYKCIHGSRAYGTNTSESDFDYKGIAIAPLNFYLGFCDKFEQSEKYVAKGDNMDEVIYDIQKFFNLASNCNPNIIEVLFCDEKDILYINKFGKILRENSNLFLSKKAQHTFCGYAISQLNRIKNHRRWLLNPPIKKPERSDFGLPEGKKISLSEFNAYQTLIERGETEISENVMFVLQTEKRYINAKQEWDQYQNWKQTRNKKRAELERKFGYDSKHAYHLVRLLRMGREILEGKGVIVKRPDREELCAIRDGAWKYEQLIEYADSQLKEIEEIATMSKLPKSPDKLKLDEICCDMIKSYHIIC